MPWPSRRRSGRRREGLVVVADYQSAGRGRFDRRWDAPPGKSLLFSVLARPSTAELPPSRRHLAVAAVALALAQAALRTAGVRLALKWPNDLVAPAQDRKVAGILAEAAPGDAVVIGAGVNVELGARGRFLPRSASWAARRAGRGPRRGAGGPGQPLRPLGRGCPPLPGLVLDPGQGGHRELCGWGVPTSRGRAVDVDDDGRLVVRTGPGDPVPGRLVTVAAGDVAHDRPERLGSP